MLSCVGYNDDRRHTKCRLISIQHDEVNREHEEGCTTLMYHIAPALLKIRTTVSGPSPQSIADPIIVAVSASIIVSHSVVVNVFWSALSASF